MNSSEVTSGLVIRGYGGYFYVRTREEEHLECFPRGRLRLEEDRILVGDKVEVRRLAEGKGVIEGILPRRNRLVRPPVANVDQVVIVFAAKEPRPDLSFLDRLLVVVEAQGFGVLICLNKLDLVRPEELKPILELYRGAGYDVITTSAKEGIGIEGLAARLAERVSVFAGPSGVGKSALLNAVNPGFKLTTGETSRKLGRGRHTTRGCVLLELENGGFVADTPGFSRLDLRGIRKEELDLFFPEMRGRIPQCRFPGCLHVKEPGCAVRAALNSGDIAESRYRHYVDFLGELPEPYEEKRNERD